MGIPKITFNVNTNGLELLTTDVVKVPALIITGNSVADKISIGTSVQLFSLAEAIEMGISETENPFAYKHIKDFYTQTGEGAELWVMLVSDATTMTQALDTNENIAKKLLNDSKGNVRVLGVVKQSTGTESITNGIDADVDTAVQKAQLLGEEFQKKYFPVRFILSANAFNGNTQNLKDYTETEYNKVSLLMANNDAGKEASIGLALGRLAAIPVQRNLARVLDGAITEKQAYLTNGEKVENYITQWDHIADKNYIFMRNFAGRAGYYLTDDPTLTKDNDDFKSLTNGFVMDKAVLIAYNVLVEKLVSEVPMTSSGAIHPSIIKSWQNDVESNIDGLMVQEGELSDCKVYIDETQDILLTEKLIISIQLQPVGYAKFITVNIGFTTSIN